MRQKMKSISLASIMVLSVISSKFPDSFETAHLTVGQTVFVVVTLALWFGWMTWASRDPGESDAAPAD